MLAEWTGLEPATPGVTGRYSNQLNYHSSRLEPAEADQGKANYTGETRAVNTRSKNFSGVPTPPLLRGLRTKKSPATGTGLFVKACRFFRILVVGAESLELPTYAV